MRPQKKENEEILDRLKIKQMIDYILNYWKKWKEHGNRMDMGRTPKQILHYQPALLVHGAKS
jgi:hypothetical protein